MRAAKFLIPGFVAVTVWGMTQLKALTIGSAMVDIITIIEDHDVERVTLSNATTSFLLVEPGRKIEAESISIRVGGGAVNVAVSLRRQGAQCDVLSKLGTDINADRIRAHFDREQLGRSRLISDSSLSTGSSVMIAAHDRDAAIYTQRGANTELTPDEIRSVNFDAYDLVYVSPLSKNSAKCLPVAVEEASRARCFTVVTPGIRQIRSRSPELLAALSDIDLLVMNASEAAALAPPLMAHCGECPVPPAPDEPPEPNMPHRLRVGLGTPDVRYPLQWFMKTMTGLGVRYLAITDGGGGSYLCDGKSLLHCPVHATEVKGTAGAGDAFCSTLAFGLASAMPPDRAMMRAAVNAASVVSFPDTQEGLLGLEKLETATDVASDLVVTEWPLEM